MPSVVIAAHNEEGVIGACLDALLDQGVRAHDVVVVANGCADRTAEFARERGVVVIELSQPGKALALNAGDAVAVGYPRVYLDADIVVPSSAIASVVSAFHELPSALAVVPKRHVNTERRPWPVKAYFAVNTRLPAFEKGLFGRGMIALSAEGRGRFADFPAMVADDLFLDSQFTDAEKFVTPEIEVVVDAPFTSRALLRRLVRVRRGNAQLRRAAASGEIRAVVRPSQRWAWLRVTVGHPALWASAVTYAVMTVIAGMQARRTAHGTAEWGHDTSTRKREHAGLGGGGAS